MKNKTQTITFTRKQFLALLKAVYLGNWMANAYSIKKYKKDYQSIEDLIFSQCPNFGFEQYVTHDESDGNKLYPSSYFEDTTDVHMVHAEYDVQSFWDELADNLGERDFFEKYSREEIEQMSQEEFLIKKYELIEQYEEELEEYGIMRLTLTKKEKLKRCSKLN